MKVALHPRMPAEAVAEFLETYGGQLEVDTEHSRLQVDFPEVETAFTCDRCEWTGAEPRWVDTRDAFVPPRGEIPQCPACGSFMVTPHLAEEAPNGC